MLLQVQGCIVQRVPFKDQMVIQYEIPDCICYCLLCQFRIPLKRSCTGLYFKCVRVQMCIRDRCTNHDRPINNLSVYIPLCHHVTYICTYSYSVALFTATALRLRHDVTRSRLLIMSQVFLSRRTREQFSTPFLFELAFCIILQIRTQLLLKNS